MKNTPKKLKYNQKSKNQQLGQRNKQKSQNQARVKGRFTNFKPGRNCQTQASITDNIWRKRTLSKWLLGIDIHSHFFILSLFQK